MVKDRVIFNRKSLAIALLIMTSFVVQYSNWVLGTYIPYGLLLCAAALLLVLPKDMKFRSVRVDRQYVLDFLKDADKLSICWIPAVILIGMSSFVGGLGMKEILDVFTYVICVFFLIFCGDNETLFLRAVKVIKAFSVYYAVTVWIQLLLPPVYGVYLAILPKEIKANLLELQRDYASYAGFSTNTGFTAGHLAAGMLAIFARQYHQNVSRPRQDWLTLLFLFMTLLLTGKRTHLMATIVVLCVIYIMSAKDRIRFSRIKRLVVLALVGVIALLVALIFFRSIPVVNRLAETVNGMLAGEDITSGRTKLYAYAIELFLNNPVFGIGWSRYRDVMVGVVTRVTAMDVHNIYLQLLVETGSVGFLFVLIPMVLTLSATIRQLNLQQAGTDRNVVQESVLLFSLGYQVFFLIYGITGNPFFDYNYVILYYFSCAICVASCRKMRKNHESSANNLQDGKTKVGIITFHFAHNQGAVLQCYALQTFLRKLGCDAHVIDYRPAYHTVKYSAWKNPFLLARSNWKRNKGTRIDKLLIIAARGFARGVVANVKRTDSIAEKKFGTFIDRNLSQTRLYTSLNELKWDPPRMDAYVSGSDQLWNPELLDYDFDPAYFMDFGPTDTKRLTYAVSLKEHYSDAQRRQLKQLCAGIDGLCIREENDDLVQTLGRNVQVCVDPSLLLKAEDYQHLEAAKQEKEPYLFVYGFETTDQINEAVGTIAGELGLKVVNGSPKRIRLTTACKKVYNYSPDEFLSYISQADYVVTNSFHGTAFSIIYKKKFVVVTHTTRGRRMTELLGKLGIGNRIWHDASCDWKTPIDYEAAHKKLQLLCDDARDYLLQNLS